MAVEIGNGLMTSDRTRHHAKSAGDGNWVVSYLPGRQFSIEQTIAAIRVAEEVAPVLAAVGDLATQLGLTPIEAVAMAAAACRWPEPPAPCAPEPELPPAQVRAGFRTWWLHRDGVA